LSYTIDSDENSDYMYNIIAGIINEIGPRPPCSENERKASKWIQKELEKFCENVVIEDFFCRPGAFLGFLKVVVLLTIISTIIFLFSSYNSIFKMFFSAIPLGIMVFIFYIIYKSFLHYEEFLTPLFKKKRSQNVVGTIKPSGVVKKRIIFLGHIDSTLFNVMHYTKHGYGYYIVKGIASLLFFLLIFSFQLINGIIQHNLEVFLIVMNSLVIILPVFLAIFFLVIARTEKIFFGVFKTMTISSALIILADVFYSFIIISIAFLFNQQSTLIDTALILLLINIPSCICMYFFQSKNASPGAIDNLTAVAICNCIAKILHDWKIQEIPLFPKNTEINILICGSEEAGLKGSQAFAERHAEEYNKINTTCINFESINNSRNLNIYSKETTTGTILDEEINKDLLKISEDLKIKSQITVMPPYGGGTDGAGLVRGGLRATTIEGFIRDDYLFSYHSKRDCLDLINKERRPGTDYGTNWKNRNVRCAMENALKIAIGYIKLVDGR